MAISFEVALDACIPLVMRGVPVDECVARFPEHAEQLRTHLAAFERAATLATAPVSAEAKARGRARLLAEKAALERIEAARTAAAAGGTAATSVPPPIADLSTTSGSGPSSGLRWFPDVWRYPVPRWAVGAAAVLILAIGGTGTIAASRGSLPGDTFYPVKLATERMQLALEFSERDQAELHLRFAEVRARELSTLLARQDLDHVLVATERLSSHLDSAAGLRPQIAGDSAERFQAQIAASSASVLAGLQTALAADGAPGERAGQAFESIGAAYSRALERYSPSPEVLVAAVAQGILQLRAADLPPEGVDKVLITIPRIEVLLATGGQRWVPVITDPVVLDLRQAAELPRYLGEAAVPAGTYTRIRLQVTDAVVIAGGVAHQATFSGTSFDVSRPFSVQPEQTTVVVMDFDGIDTVRISSQGRFVVDPDVRVLASEPDVTPIVPERPRGPRTPTPMAGVTATPTVASPSTSAEVQGVVEAEGPGFITVQGKRIDLPTQVIGKGPESTPAKGAEVRIEVEIEDSGRFRAVEVEVLKTPATGGRGATSTPAASPTPGGVAGTPAEFTGTIGAVTGNRWIVGGRPVHVDRDTRVIGEAEVGGTARVIGVLGPDGSIRATVLIVEAAPAPTPTTTPSPPPTPERSPAPPIAGPREGERPTPQRPGKQATPTASPTTPTATQPPPAARVVEIKGKIESMEGGTWKVDGRDIRITSATVIVGVLAIGADAQVVGREDADGSAEVSDNGASAGGKGEVDVTITLP